MEVAAIQTLATTTDPQPLVAAVSFHGVHKNFAAKPEDEPFRLSDINGEVPEGKVLTLVGPSGSGKSTLLGLCNLFLTPDEGEVRVLGREIRDWQTPMLRKTVGLVFQTPTMFPGTVLENLSLASKIHGHPLSNARELLARVGLEPDLLNRAAQDLSGGQKQRVALARALANEPKVLLLDEITSALDPAAAKDVEELILGLRREQNTSVIWVTHHLEQARRVGDLTWLLVGGRLVESGATEAFFENPQRDETRRFLRGELSGRDV